jgi:SAM-dependent methyltransferase
MSDDQMEAIDRDATLAKYRNGFEEHGYSPKALGWDKGRQDIRFGVLLGFFPELKGKTILDIGCGFGDLNRAIQSRVGDDYSYVGVDLVGELVDVARERNQGANLRFVEADFLAAAFDETFDVVVSSGIFNHKFESGENDSFTDRVLAKAFSLCREGIAFDFLSDKVDYRYEHTYHHSPERILGVAYGLSRRVMLRNDYMPFEFSVYVGKDDSFEPGDAVFAAHKQRDPGAR